MKAMVVKQGTINAKAKIKLEDIPFPDPGPRDLLVKVRAASVNRADILQLQGRYPSLGSDGKAVLGLEAAGEVVSAGEEVMGFKAGDRVAGLCAGGYSEYTTIDYRLAIPVPHLLFWQEAAACPLGYMTAYNAMITNGNLQAGRSIMITAASSGVGVAGIQLARFFSASLIVGTSGSPHKFPRLKSLGVDQIIDYRNENITEEVNRATKGHGVDIILDHVGGENLSKQLKALAIKGRMISVGRLGEAVGELDMELLAKNRLRIIGVTFRTRTLEEKIVIAQNVIALLLPALTEGRLRPIVDRTFSLDDATEALDYMRSNMQIGKIVLLMD
jgi:putative PIG3 family NAD(P)H quinone oxidoreductase